VAACSTDQSQRELLQSWSLLHANSLLPIIIYAVHAAVAIRASMVTLVIHLRTAIECVFGVVASQGQHSLFQVQPWPTPLCFTHSGPILLYAPMPALMPCISWFECSTCQLHQGSNTFANAFQPALQRCLTLQSVVVMHGMLLSCLLTGVNCATSNWCQWGWLV
jgi:hypothetical protein